MKAPNKAKGPTRLSGPFALWHPDGIFLERGNPMRQKRQERFWTASAGRVAANPMEGVSNEYSESGLSKRRQFAVIPGEHTRRSARVQTPTKPQNAKSLMLL